MKLLISDDQFTATTSRQEIPLECETCKKTFYLKKHRIQCVGSHKSHQDGRFCSRRCLGVWTTQNNSKKVICPQCSKEFKRTLSEIKRNKNNFCSRSCQATHTNSHKTTGTNRSKLEVYLERELKKIFPQTKFAFNDIQAIGAELDIYLPDLRIAFELNGIFHYEPIFGETKLAKTQNNDQRKFAACAEKEIGLCVIDTTSLSYFKEEKAKKFLDIVVNIIKKSADSIGVEPNPF